LQMDARNGQSGKIFSTLFLHSAARFDSDALSEASCGSYRRAFNSYCGTVNHLLAEKSISGLILAPPLLLIMWVSTHCHDMMPKCNSLPK
jgi:hypothetical protein